MRDGTIVTGLVTMILSALIFAIAFSNGNSHLLVSILAFLTLVLTGLSMAVTSIANAIRNRDVS